MRRPQGRGYSQPRVFIPEMTVAFWKDFRRWMADPGRALFLAFCVASTMHERLCVEHGGSRIRFNTRRDSDREKAVKIYDALASSTLTQVMDYFGISRAAVYRNQRIALGLSEVERRKIRSRLAGVQHPDPTPEEGEQGIAASLARNPYLNLDWREYRPLVFRFFLNQVFRRQVQGARDKLSRQLP